MKKLNMSKFRKVLASKLETTHDLVDISRWAYGLFLESQREMTEDVREFLLDLARMEDAEEFEYTIEELIDLTIDKDVQN